jgi:hypothetical protein
MTKDNVGCVMAQNDEVPQKASKMGTVATAKPKAMVLLRCTRRADGVC